MLKKLLSFELDSSLPQRKLLELGQLLSRVVVMEMVLKLGDKGFSKELIDNCLNNLYQEISSFLTSYSFDNRSELIDVEQRHPSWRDCLD